MLQTTDVEEKIIKCFLEKASSIAPGIRLVFAGRTDDLGDGLVLQISTPQDLTEDQIDSLEILACDLAYENKHLVAVCQHEASNHESQPLTSAFLSVQTPAKTVPISNANGLFKMRLAAVAAGLLLIGSAGYSLVLQQSNMQLKASLASAIEDRNTKLIPTSIEEARRKVMILDNSLAENKTLSDHDKAAARMKLANLLTDAILVGPKDQEKAEDSRRQIELLLAEFNSGKPLNKVISATPKIMIIKEERRLAKNMPIYEEDK